MQLPLAPSFQSLGDRQERGGELLAEAEEVLDPFAVSAEGLGAVAALDGPVQLRVGPPLTCSIESRFRRDGAAVRP